MSNSVAPQKRSCFYSGFIVSSIIVVVLCVLSLIGGVVLVGIELMNSENFTQYSQNKGVKKLSETVVRSGDSNNRIALIDVEGVIGSNNKHTEFIITSLKQASKDASVNAILIRVDSPGGTVTASDAIHHAVMQVKEVKPVVVYMDNIAASGGYYISCAANHITANPHTLTGSIGVIISSVNVKELMDKIGVKPMVYTSGDFKDMLSLSKTPTEAEKEYIQSLVMESYDGFLEIVSQGRNLSKETLQSRNAVDGRVLSGKKAKELGLVDSLGYLDDALTEAQVLGEIDGVGEVFRYKQFRGMDNLFELLMETDVKSSQKIQVELMPNSLPQLKPGVPYLLPSFYAAGDRHE